MSELVEIHCFALYVICKALCNERHLWWFYFPFNSINCWSAAPSFIETRSESDLKTPWWEQYYLYLFCRRINWNSGFKWLARRHEGFSVLWQRFKRMNPDRCQCPCSKWQMNSAIITVFKQNNLLTSVHLQKQLKPGKGQASACFPGANKTVLHSFFSCKCSSCVWDRENPLWKCGFQKFEDHPVTESQFFPSDLWIVKLLLLLLLKKRRKLP